MTRAWSIARRLRWQVLGLVALAWIATIVLSAYALTHEMNEFFDEELGALVETTALLLDAREGDAIPRALGIAPEDGERILRILSPDQPHADGPWPPIATDGFHDAEGWRILRRSVDNVVIEAAHSRAWRQEEIAEAGAAFLVLILPLLALLGFLLPRSLRRSLAPLNNLSQEIAARAPDDLRVIDATGLPEEATPLVAAINGYIARVATLRDAERSFISNASHELRTPLAVIRSEVEQTGGDVATRILPAIDRLLRRVERLLQMSRAESGVGRDPAGGDVVKVLGFLIEDARKAGADVLFDDGDLERLRVPVDADALAIVLRNLIENAVGHGTGRVRITLRPDRVAIENPTTEDAQFLAAPFAKGAASQGTGLGLAIVARLCETMGIKITQRIGNGRARVTLEFPAQSE